MASAGSSRKPTLAPSDRASDSSQPGSARSLAITAGAAWMTVSYTHLTLPTICSV